MGNQQFGFHNPQRALTLALLPALLLPALVLAGPADKIYLPRVAPGETGVELRGGYEDADRGSNPYQSVFDIGYGVNEHWATELSAHYDNANPEYDKGAKDHGGEISSLEWENILVFTEPGRYWLESGLYAALVYDTEAKDWVVEGGPLLQKTVKHEQFNLNFLLERKLQSDVHTELLYRAQWKHRAGRSLEYGLQSFGRLGQFGSLGDADEYKLGPALFGTMRAGQRAKWRWNGALLAGINRSAPDISLRFELEYEYF